MNRTESLAAHKRRTNGQNSGPGSAGTAATKSPAQAVTTSLAAVREGRAAGIAPTASGAQRQGNPINPLILKTGEIHDAGTEN